MLPIFNAFFTGANGTGLK